MKILIADDDATSRTILEMMLAKWGYETVSASDGEAAWAALQEPAPPPLAILDRMMPGLDGSEVCQRLRALEGAAPVYVILLTAMSGKQHVVSGLEAGADDYVQKPFDPNELQARIRVGLRVVELQRKLAERVTELEGALAEVKTLRGLLPICMHCHKIRTDGQVWQRIEEYIENHSEAQFSHSLCPACLEKHYPTSAD